MSCYITCVMCHVMLYNKCYVMLYNTCHILLFNICHINEIENTKVPLRVYYYQEL